MRQNEDIICGLKNIHPEFIGTLETRPTCTDEDTLLIRCEDVLRVVRFLHQKYPFLMDICGVDYPDREKRFNVVYHFANPKMGWRLRLKTMVAEGEKLDSVLSVYRSADWFEREVYDMYGICFKGRGSLRRILCHKDFVGHPLRKDYPADGNQTLSAPMEHTYAQDRDRMMQEEEDHLSDKVWLNIGPAHPATHGTLRLMAVMSGEVIEEVDLEIGYLHRCFEKMCETHSYHQVIPYTDRLNYCSAPINNHAWVRTVEKMLDIEAPPRAQAMRVILDEFSRCIDHLVCVGANAVDLGGLTNFLFAFQAREKVYDLFEKLCGARLTVSLARIGGMGFDFPDGWVEQARKAVQDIRQAHHEVDTLCTRNRIFMNRMMGVGVIGREDAINWGFTGPCLRATGEPRDIRIDQPYSLYDQFEFDVPIGHKGDAYDRYQVRMAEILESCRIIEQALDCLPAGSIMVDDPSVAIPKKEDVYGNIEGLMNQFMLVINGIQPPAGEAYVCTEAANGELGFYVVSDGSGKPYRVKCRPPCFAIFQAFPQMIKGGMLADAIATLGSINIIAGELDR